MLIPLALKVGKKGRYQLMFNDFKLENQEQVSLEDTKTGIVEQVTGNHLYVFDAGINDTPLRFNLHFGISLKIPEYNTLQINIYSFGKVIYVSSTEIVDGVIEVYDMLGQKMVSKSLFGERFYSINMKENQGYFIVKFIDDNSVITKKIYLK